MQCICLTFIQTLFAHFTQTTRDLFYKSLVFLRGGKNVSYLPTPLETDPAQFHSLCLVFLCSARFGSVTCGGRRMGHFSPVLPSHNSDVFIFYYLAILKTIYIHPLSSNHASSPWTTEIYLGAAQLKAADGKFVLSVWPLD